MLVAHSNNRDNGDGRVLVHSADHREGDQCWIIQGVQRQGVPVGYTIVKSTVSYLLSYFNTQLFTQLFAQLFIRLF